MDVPRQAREGTGNLLTVGPCMIQRVEMRMVPSDSRFSWRVCLGARGTKDAPPTTPGKTEEAEGETSPDAGRCCSEWAAERRSLRGARAAGVS